MNRQNLSAINLEEKKEKHKQLSIQIASNGAKIGYLNRPLDVVNCTVPILAFLSYSDINS